MAREAGFDSVQDLIDRTIPEPIRLAHSPNLPKAITEHHLLQRAAEIGARNRPFRSFIGQGYADTITPPPILRNIMENPNWYTQYTPYQAEIAQGRLEALLNYQTMVIDLTGMEIANASLLDEGTAAAEAMMMARRLTKGDRNTFFVSERCHPQTIAVVKTRAVPLNVDVVVGDHESFEFTPDVYGALVQYPTTDGEVLDYSGFCNTAHNNDALVVVAADLLSLTLLTPPGEFGADVVVGNSQRFGVPLGYGGPHAAFFATRDDYKRQVPGRIIGVSVDADGNPALRMALQTREQHIRRDKATSNICTSQVLLAVMAGAYAVYHGPEGLRAMAGQVHGRTRLLAEALKSAGSTVRFDAYFDTIRVDPKDSAADIRTRALAAGINLRYFDDGSIGVSLDEATAAKDVSRLAELFGADVAVDLVVESARLNELPDPNLGAFARTSDYLTHPVFHLYRSETELMRYLHRLSSRDLSLTTSMIPLGSCTMKLNAAAELMPITWAEFNRIHPFAPTDQAAGYAQIIDELKTWLGEITGLPHVSLQPNSGASGEYAGLLSIRGYHEANGDTHRNICLIPESAHGTNPASAIMAGMKVVAVKCDDDGNIDIPDLQAKAEQYRDTLAALMITYPSTHGVFETGVRSIMQAIHDNGGLVYMDGANMNAQVGLCSPGDIGADVCHLNLHKTFSIPHGGGGPGMGPIAVNDKLKPFLPGHPELGAADNGQGPVSAAPYGSASILLISWAYIAMMGAKGLRRATEVAILNANYIAAKLAPHFDILYRGKNGTVAHEFILDLRPFRQTAGVTEVDVAKRLMDYGYHAPTMSWPVAGTMMIEPTESESREELDKFIEAMRSIRAEIQEVELGLMEKGNNTLTNAPHTMTSVVSDSWSYPYSREKAAFPAPWTREHKFWPGVRRVNDAHGDRNLVCACPPMEEYV